MSTGYPALLCLSMTPLSSLPMLVRFYFILFLSISVWLLGKLFGKVINGKVLDPFFIYIFCFCLCFVLGLLNYTQNWLLREDGKALKKMKIVGSFFLLCS